MSEVEEFLAKVLELRDACLDETDAETFVGMLELMREIKRRVSDWVRDCEEAAADTFGGQRDWEVGRYRLEVRASDSRKWRNDDLVSAVRRVARFDPDTGAERSTEECLRIFTEAFRCTGNEVRRTFLKQHEIDVDEYSYDAKWRTTVRVIPIAPEVSDDNR